MCDAGPLLLTSFWPVTLCVGTEMVWWSMLVLVLALAAGLIGYAGITWGVPHLAEAMLLTFLCLLIVSLLLYFWPRRT